MVRVTNLVTFIEKANIVHKNKYDYSKSIYTKSSIPLIIKCPIHGEFLQKPNNHLNGQTCPYCSKRGSIEEFIKRAKEKHGNKFDYSKTEYLGATKKLKIICPKHGEFWCLPNNHINGAGGCIKCFEYKNKTNINSFLSKAKEIHGNTYDYSKINYIDFKTEIEIVCSIHGSFWQKPKNHIYNKAGCIKCYHDSTRTKVNDFINSSNRIHNSFYKYDKIEYKNSMTKVEIVCPVHGSFFQIPRDHLIGKGCPSCALASSNSKWEGEIFNFIKLEKEKNNRTLLNNLELDIFIPNKKIAIECNGNYWHSEIKGKKNKKYHLTKTEMCENVDVQLLHIFESEWVLKQEIVKSLINSKLGLSNRIYARKCKVDYVSTSLKNKFLESTHLQGADKSKIKLGLFYDSKLVAIMTFCKSRFNKKYEWELSRFSSDLNTTVVGGASKLLNRFIIDYKPKSIISYANRRYSSGNLYKKLGFEFLHNSEPNFFYTKNYLNLYTRQSFQKHKLNKKLSNFDSSKTEWENMKLNGYDRIWDCGNGVFGINIIYDNKSHKKNNIF